MKLYRYEIDTFYVDNGLFDKKVIIEEFEVTKETKCGRWIDYYGTKKWVKKDGNTIFAHDTKEKALNHFIRRKTFYLRKLTFKVKEVSKALREASKYVDEFNKNTGFLREILDSPKLLKNDNSSNVSKNNLLDSY